MKCRICNKEFKPIKKQVCCSEKCSEENERRYNSRYYKSKVKGRRKLTQEQIEKNRERNRKRYQKMTPEEKAAYLAEKRHKRQQNKKKK